MTLLELRPGHGYPGDQWRGIREMSRKTERQGRERENKNRVGSPNNTTAAGTGNPRINKSHPTGSARKEK